MIARVAARPIARALPRQSAIQQNLRSLHVDNKVYNNMPFQYRNGGGLAFKMIAFCGLGFSIPFIASAYQISKAAAS
ncbi:hypothetical protein OIO90_003240 [Microbotryomycetes sp. JL221]|nr:hypothetical protein OIO90_003240 [Microbotryomycetes sp. JL221]